MNATREIRVLVIDDDAVTRRVTSAMLGINGFAVTTGENGLDAVRLAVTCLPDIIVMDIMMPDMDGISAIEALRNDPATSDIPVIAVSGLPSVEIAGDVMARGAAGFLQKPFLTKDLLGKLRELKFKA